MLMNMAASRTSEQLAGLIRANSRLAIASSCVFAIVQHDCDCVPLRSVGSYIVLSIKLFCISISNHIYIYIYIHLNHCFLLVFIHSLWAGLKLIHICIYIYIYCIMCYCLIARRLVSLRDATLCEYPLRLPCVNSFFAKTLKMLMNMAASRTVELAGLIRANSRLAIASSCVVAIVHHAGDCVPLRWVGSSIVLY